MKNIPLTICFKEIRDILRDKRSMSILLVSPFIIMFVLPAILVLVGIPSPTSSAGIVVMNGDEEFFSYLDSSAFFTIEKLSVNADISTSTIKKIVNEGKIFILFTRNNTINVEIYYNSRNPKSTVVVAFINNALTRYEDYLVKESLKNNFDLSDSEVELALNPLEVKNTDFSPTTTDEKTDVGKTFLSLVPFLFVMWSGSSCFGIVIDIFTGEKERKTFEPLLSLPIKRSDVVFGKFLSVFTINAVLTLPLVFLSIFGLIAVFKRVLTTYNIQNIVITLDGRIIASMIVMFLLYTALVSALIIIPAIAAKSFRQASIYTFPMYTFTMLLAISSLLVTDIKFYYCFLPVVGAIISTTGLFSGATGTLELAIAVVTSLFYIVLILKFVTYMFSRDNVMFRE